MNILITSAGRRVSLIKSFQKVLSKFENGQVFAGDVDFTAPSIKKSDKGIILPHIDSEDYISYILRIAIKNKIRLIIPMLDQELPLFSQNISRFTSKGIHVMVSNLKSIKISNDKKLTYSFFKKNKIPTPITYDLKKFLKNKNNQQYPILVKPRFGQRSEGVSLCKNANEVKFFTNNSSEWIVQEYLTGSEITIDLFGDGKGKIFSFVPRKRLKIRAGESERAVTIDHKLFLKHVLKIGKEAKPFGAWNIQCFLTDKEPLFTEMNARFGGGYPLSDKAGAKFPELLLQLVNKKRLTSIIGKYQKGLLMSRYDEAVFSKYHNISKIN